MPTLHDRLLKNLIKLFFPDLIQLLLPELTGDLDLGRATWLDKETFADLRDGDQAVADLVAHLPTFDRRAALLLHIEIESEYRQRTEKRLQRYSLHLRLTYRLPVLTLALFLSGGPADLQEHLQRHALSHLDANPFRYTTFGVRGCSPEQWLRRPQPLAWALSALMRPQVWSRPRLKLECLKRILHGDLGKVREGVLVNIVHTYLPLDDQEEEDMMAMLQQDINAGVEDLDMTWFGRIRRQARIEELRTLLSEQLGDKFGPLKPATTSALGSLDRDQLRQLGRKLLRAQSLEELGLT